MRRPINTPPNREWLKKLFALINRRNQLYTELGTGTVLPQSTGKVRHTISVVNKEIEVLERTTPEQLFLQGNGHAVRERHALSSNGNHG